MTRKKYQLLGSATTLYPFAIPHVPPKRGSSVQQPLTPPPVELSPPLNKGERGGVLGRAAKVTRSSDMPDGQFRIETRDNDDGAIKVALLMVDKIDKPTNSFIGSREDDAKDVTGIGLGFRSRAIFDEIPNYSQMSSFVWHAYRELENREPGRWSLWQQYDSHIIPKELLSPDLAFQLEITNGLIVPDASTPFEDVIAFKERHNDELIAFRHHLEEFAIKLSKEGDPRAANLERERFDVALAEYLRKARHSNIKKAIASLTTELDWAAAVRSAAGGGSGGLLAAAQGLSLTAAAAAIGGGVLAGLSIKSVAGLREGPSPFRYLARIEKEYGG